MTEGQQLFSTAVADFEKDIKAGWNAQQPIIDAGYKPGLMLVMLAREEGETPRVMDPENVRKQYDNLVAAVGNVYGNSAIVTMLPNMPLSHTDFLHNGNFVVENVLAGIEFAKGLPIGDRKLLTFHTNNFVNPKEFASLTRSEWYDVLGNEMQPRLEKIRRAGNDAGVEVLVESYPMPVFGDYMPGDGAVYRGVHLRDLREVSYLVGNNGTMRMIRGAGLGICLDICHHQSVYDAIETSGDQGILFPEDINEIRAEGRTLVQDVYDLNPETDLVHLNDLKGRFTTSGGKFDEGVSLGRGRIETLPFIIGSLKRGVPTIFEVHEENYEIPERPNASASMRYFLNPPTASSLNPKWK